MLLLSLLYTLTSSSFAGINYPGENPIQNRTYLPNEWGATLSYTLPFEYREYYRVEDHPGLYFMLIPENSPSQFKGNHAFFSISFNENTLKPAEFRNLLVRQSFNKPVFTPAEETICLLSDNCAPTLVQKKKEENISTLKREFKTETLKRTISSFESLFKRAEIPQEKEYLELCGKIYASFLMTDFKNIKDVDHGIAQFKIKLATFFEPAVGSESIGPFLEKYRTLTADEKTTIGHDMEMRKSIFMAGIDIINETLSVHFKPAVSEACLNGGTEKTQNYCQAHLVYLNELNKIMPGFKRLSADEIKNLGLR